MGQTDRRTDSGNVVQLKYSRRTYLLDVSRPEDHAAGLVTLSVSVCLSQASIVSKRMNGSSWFLATGLLSTYPTHVVRKSGYLHPCGVPRRRTGDVHGHGAVTATAPCLCLQSVTSRCRIETSERIELVFGKEAFSTRPTLCCKDIWTV